MSSTAWNTCAACMLVPSPIIEPIPRKRRSQEESVRRSALLPCGAPNICCVLNARLLTLARILLRLSYDIFLEGTWGRARSAYHPWL
jgi:hypothetical protein